VITCSTYSFEDEAWEIFFNTLINYTTTLSQDDIDALNSRPNAQSGEFKTGAVRYHLNFHLTHVCLRLVHAS
jgi:hypothetical protein